ncbi:MAG: glycosyltransferase family 2 protein [Thermomicrobiales bacterium]
MLSRLLSLLVLLQALFGLRVVMRLLRTAGGETINAASWQPSMFDSVSVIVPVLNERDRLGPCLEGLLAQGPEVSEILVVDGGSIDGTQGMVVATALRDPRVRLIDASPIPDGWNGKAWGLQAGLDRVRSTWALTIDADVVPAPALVRSLLAHADTTGLDVLSVATRQELGDMGSGLLHPAMLTTLVYRFGIPGGRYRRIDDVQANGQCFLARRAALEEAGGFAAVRESICEDITLARRLVERGHEVGFFESDSLISARMYPDWRATWRNWPRSLPMRDRYFGMSGALGLAEVLLVQALPLPLLGLSWLASNGRGWLLRVNAALVLTRLGILAGTARAYDNPPLTYWLSPLIDLPVAIRLIASALRREHTWRGRVLVRGGS